MRHRRVIVGRNRKSDMIKKILIALIIVVVALVGIGLFLPGEFDVSRTIVIKGKPADIYPHIAKLEDWQKWTVWNPRTKGYEEMVTKYSGEESGVGAKSEWSDPASGNGKMEITKADKPDRVEWKLEFEGMTPADGYCTLKLVERDRTRVEFGMKGDMGSNPVSKYFALMMDSMMGAEFDENLKNLKDMVEDPEGYAKKIGETGSDDPTEADPTREGDTETKEAAKQSGEAGKEDGSQ